MVRQRVVLSAWLSLVGWIPGFSQVAEVVDTKTTTPEIRDAIVVTAQFKPESVMDSLYPVKVISQAEIRARGAATLRELLQQELKIDVSHHSVFGSSLTLNGVSKENVEILIDGMPLVGRLNGILDLDQIGLEGIRQVEILDGPASLYYGSEALGGVVHLITDQYHVNQNQGSVMAGYGSEGEVSSGANVSTSARGFVLSAEVGVRQFDGFDADKANRNRDWNDRDQRYGQMGVSKNIGTQILRVQTRLLGEEMEDFGNVTNGLATDTLYETKRGQHQVSLRGQALEKMTTELMVGLSDYDRRGESFQRAIPYLQNNSEQALASDKTTFDQWLGRGLLTVEDLKPWISAQIGFEFTSESGTGGRLSEAAESVQDLGLFSSLRFQLSERITLQPGVRYTGNSVFQSHWTPALHGRWEPGESQKLKASYSQGFRTPSLKETYLDFVMQAGPSTYHILGNQELQPERGDHVRFAWDGFGGEKSWHHLGVSTDAFFFQIDDLIALSALVPITGQPGHFTRSYINVKEHRSYGGSISSYLQVKNLNLKAGVGYVALWNDLEQYDQIPEYQGAWEANFQSNYQWTATGANLALFYKYRGSKPGFVQARDGSLSELTLREAHQMDMTLQYPLFANKLSLEAGIENLFDNENLDQMDLALGTAHAEIPVGWGRTYSARIRYQF